MAAAGGGELVALVRELQAQRCQHLDRLVVEFERVCGELERIAYWLARSQPPGDGKFGVVWWLCGRELGGVRVREPVLVRWRRARNGMWRAVRVRRANARVRESGVWRLNARETEELVAMYWLKRREWERLMRFVVMGVGGRFDRWVRGVLGEVERLDVEGVGDRIRRHLIEAGYVGDV